MIQYEVHTPLGPHGHRRPGYKRTEEDVIREQIAEDRRIRRAAKRHNDYLRCLANNPCLRRTA